MLLEISSPVESVRVNVKRDVGRLVPFTVSFNVIS